VEDNVVKKDVEDDSDWFWGESKEEEIVHVEKQIINDNVEDIVVKETVEHPFFNSYNPEEEEE